MKTTILYAKKLFSTLNSHNIGKTYHITLYVPTHLDNACYVDFIVKRIEYRETRLSINNMWFLNVPVGSHVWLCNGRSYYIILLLMYFIKHHQPTIFMRFFDKELSVISLLQDGLRVVDIINGIDVCGIIILYECVIILP